MKILDVKVTVWKWTGIPPVNYSLTIKGVSKSVDMALLTIYTDEGFEGHAFIGSALYGIGKDSQQIIDRYRPALVGRDPLVESVFGTVFQGWRSVFRRCGW